MPVTHGSIAKGQMTLTASVWKPFKVLVKWGHSVQSKFSH